jgi:hypothetical protein
VDGLADGVAIDTDTDTEHTQEIQRGSEMEQTKPDLNFWVFFTNDHG